MCTNEEASLVDYDLYDWANSTGNDTDQVYDYDHESSINVFYWDELLPALIVYTTTILLGVTGNLLIIITISKYRRMKSITNIFLASLASADLLLIIICTPVKLAKLFSYTWDMGFFMCKMVHYMQNVSAICSVFTLTAMSVERYYAIVHPMKARYVCTIRQARKIIATTWVASFILALPVLFVQCHKKVGVKITGFWCVRDCDPVAWRAHEIYMLVIVLMIPATVMVITYSAICREICRVAKRRFHMTSAKGNKTCESFALNTKLTPKFKTKTQLSTQEDHRATRQISSYDSEKQVIKMLVAVVIAFIVCWTPLLVDNVLTSFCILGFPKMGFVKHMNTYFSLLAYFNSCVNPVVYGFMSKNFRESFTKALCCKKKSVRRQLSVSHTRTTSIRTYLN